MDDNSTEDTSDPVSYQVLSGRRRHPTAPCGLLPDIQHEQGMDGEEGFSSLHRGFANIVDTHSYSLICCPPCHSLLPGTTKLEVHLSLDPVSPVALIR